MEIPKALFEEAIDKMKQTRGVKLDTELTADDLKELVKIFKDIYRKNREVNFLQIHQNN